MKTQKEVIEFLNIIIKDDVPSFFVKFKHFKNVSFGKFPLLSVLYLFEAKKITKKYEKELLNITEFSVEFEPFEIYRKFKKISNKSLRLYLTNNFIMPMEMLAILNEDSKVKKIYEKSKQNNLNSNLEKIYSYNNQKVKFSQNNIKISKKSLKKHQKKFFLISESLIAMFLIIVSFMYIFSYNINGSGTEQSPKTINSISQLKTISSSNLHYKLYGDLTINSYFKIDNFSGVIDGQNNTLTLNYNSNNSLFETFSGVIKNLNIVYANENLTQNKTFSLLVNNNYGTLDNINLDINCKINNSSKDEISNFSCFANTNNGTINNCSAKVSITANSNNSYDSFLGVYANVNNGTINNCVVQENSTILTKNIDTCGICITNNAGATITNCSNYTLISEESNIADFAPLVCGISINNFGLISYCYNYANLTAVNTASNSSNNFANVAGISCFNSYDISFCINYGNINCHTTNMNIYAGGISGYSYNNNANEDANILNCGSLTSFNVSNESSENYIFCGGITGFIVGNVKNCFSNCTYENDIDIENKNYYALVVGCTYAQQNWFGQVNLFFRFEKVYCIETENIKNVISAFDSYYGVNQLENENIKAEENGYTILQSFSQLTESEVYWHE